jgi:hypothetical protein
MFSAAYCKAHGQNEHKMHWEKFMLFKMVSTQQIHFAILEFLLKKPISKQNFKLFG